MWFTLLVDLLLFSGFCLNVCYCGLVVNELVFVYCLLLFAVLDLRVFVLISVYLVTLVGLLGLLCLLSCIIVFGFWLIV